VSCPLSLSLPLSLSQSAVMSIVRLLYAVLRLASYLHLSCLVVLSLSSFVWFLVLVVSEEMNGCVRAYVH
jgi:hypothetical protein